MIYKAKKITNYVQINNEMLKDPKLSAKAKGLLCYILSLPDDWVIRKVELSKHFTDGKDSINSGFNELIKTGYVISAGRIRSEKGQLFDYEYLVYEISIHSNNFNAVYPNSEKPTQVNPTQVKPQLLIKEDTKERVTKDIYKYKNQKLFYKEQLLISTDLKKEYSTFIDILFGENDMGIILDNILGLELQVDYNQFTKLFAVKQEYKKSIAEALMGIENVKKYTKGRKSLYTIIRKWLKSEF